MIDPGLKLRLLFLIASVWMQAQLHGMKSFEAVITGSAHVTVLAKDFHDAQDKIKAIYCGGRDCILEGPWEKH